MRGYLIYSTKGFDLVGENIKLWANMRNENPIIYSFIKSVLQSGSGLKFINRHISRIWKKKFLLSSIHSGDAEACVLVYKDLFSPFSDEIIEDTSNNIAAFISCALVSGHARAILPKMFAVEPSEKHLLYILFITTLTSNVMKRCENIEALRECVALFRKYSDKSELKIKYVYELLVYHNEVEGVKFLLNECRILPSRGFSSLFKQAIMNKHYDILIIFLKFMDPQDTINSFFDIAQISEDQDFISSLLDTLGVTEREVFSESCISYEEIVPGSMFRACSGKSEHVFEFPTLYKKTSCPACTLPLKKKIFKRPIESVAEEN